MIVVDSCIWIDFFKGVESPAVALLTETVGGREALLGDQVALEVLRGFCTDADYRTALAAFETLPSVDMLGYDRAVRAAARYRSLRRRGITVRKSGDVTIASYCIDEGHTLLTVDRDFAPFVEHLDLTVLGLEAG